MAAYFIQYKYHTSNGFLYNDDCIITYERFEKVDDKSFYTKFNEKVKEFHYSDIEATITNIIKL